jgi:hypothetical protein
MDQEKCWPGQLAISPLETETVNSSEKRPVWMCPWSGRSTKELLLDLTRNSQSSLRKRPMPGIAWPSGSWRHNLEIFNDTPEDQNVGRA